LSLFIPGCSGVEVSSGVTRLGDRTPSLPCAARLGCQVVKRRNEGRDPSRGMIPAARSSTERRIGAQVVEDQTPVEQRWDVPWSWGTTTTAGRKPGEITDPKQLAGMVRMLLGGQCSGPAHRARR
jgi:hypothetical protein